MSVSAHVEAGRGVATAASTQPWFVTAHSTGPRMIDGRVEERPTSVAHAKRMGSPATACGVPATTWPKLFGQAFPLPGSVVCAQCVAVVRADGAR